MKAHTFFLTDVNGKPRLRTINDPPGFLLAVDPRGRIRTLSYGLNGTSSKLRSELVTHNKRPIGRKGIALSDEAREAGWRHLEDVYADEIAARGIEGEAAKGLMRNYDQVVRWYQVAAARKSGTALAPLDERYLPSALRNGGDYEAPVLTGGLDLEPPWEMEAESVQGELPKTGKTAKPKAQAAAATK